MVALLRFAFGLGVERFERLQHSLTERGGSGSCFGSYRKRFWWSWFRLRFLEKGFRRFWFPVPVVHPGISIYSEKRLIHLNFRDNVRAILSVRPKFSHRCISLQESSLNLCNSSRARDQNINRANVYENEMV